MKSLATLRMTTKLGYISTWTFCQVGDWYIAAGSCSSMKASAPPKTFDSLKGLRTFYQSMLRYGFRPIVDADSELPVQLQLDLAALSAA